LALLVSVLVERNGSNPAITCRSFIDVPCIKGCISGDVGRELFKRHGRFVGERTKIGNVIFIERLGVFCQDHIPIVRSRRSCHPRAIAPQVFFFRSGGAVSLLLVEAALDAQFAIAVAYRLPLLVEAILQISAGVVFLDPGRDVLDVKSNDFSQPRDLLRANRAQ